MAQPACVLVSLQRRQGVQEGVVNLFAARAGAWWGGRVLVSDTGREREEPGNGVMVKRTAGAAGAGRGGAAAVASAGHVDGVEEGFGGKWVFV
jgi:hypothetical protein